VLVSAVIPTRDRPEDLGRTLATIGALPRGAGLAEVVVVDNDSASAPALPGRLENGVRVEAIRLDHNAGAAARNAAAEAASGEWLMMLDDDSAPLDGGFGPLLREAPADAAAVGAEILLPSGLHEAGGLPEVFVGCGALIRRDAFLDAGGYDGSLHYYGEETDLCAKLLARGWRVTHSRRFRVRHCRSDRGRDHAGIVERLTCNEPLVWRRYAPAGERELWIERSFARRRAVAERENAMDAYERGRDRFLRLTEHDPIEPLSRPLWDRLVGRTHVERHVVPRVAAPVAVWAPPGAPGKHAELIEEAISARGLLRPSADANAHVTGTLAPGLAIDAMEACCRLHPASQVVCTSAFQEYTVQGSCPALP